MFCSRDTGKLYNSRGATSCEQPPSRFRKPQKRVKMRDEKPGKRKESSLVIAARYSEIGFMVPAAVLVGYLLGLGADHLLHTHWLYIFGIFVGAVAGFVSMIRRALRANEDGDKEERDRSNDGR